jgi:rod shape-determining protein MreC
VSEYFSLRKTNVELARENLELRQRLRSSFYIPDTGSYVRRDSLFRYTYARVIRNTVNKQKNYIMINKGKHHGLDRDMGVITASGVVGIVVEVTDHYARIMSVLHIQNKINARIKKNRHLGNIEWDGKDYRTGLLTDIPSHVSLQAGDTIITSGNSLIFPEGLVIGTVEEFNPRSSDKFNTARVRFSVDYNSLHHVLIITNLMKDELEQLEIEE